MQNARWGSLGRRISGAGLLLALCCGGCPFTGKVSDGASSLDDSENDTFETATAVSLDDKGQARISGAIDSAGDTDIYDLGVLAAGDRLYIDVQATSGDLDPMAAVFDEREYLLAFNDDRTPDASDLNPLIDVIVPEVEGHYYLGLTPYTGGYSTGDYQVDLEITRAVGVLEPEPQIVYLDWVGGENIQIENVGVFDIEPFDAADLGPYDGQTEEMKDAIEAAIADRYDGFDLVLRNSDDHARPTDPHSTVYFGGYQRSAFAIAEQIDTFNVDQTDNAIVFTESFSSAFSTTPSLEEMATAVGNTTAHEIGHLLGLVHTKDCSGLMDTTCSNDALLSEQNFKLSSLDDSVFPVGMQNALELIEWAIGLAGL